MPEKKLTFFLTLFWQTFKISAFTFGGGYVIVSLMKKQFVDKLGWLSEKEMLDFTAIAQSAPGPIAVNASILLGYKLGGARGATTAILGTILPPLILLTAISYIYTWFISITAIRYVMLGMQAGVAAVICDVVWGLTLNIWKQNHWIAVITAILAFVLVAFLSVNVMIIVVVCLAWGILMYGREDRSNGTAA